MEKKEEWTVATGAEGNGHGRWPAGMHPPAIFQALLRHERSRSDRDGSEFSLVVFDVTGMQPGDRRIHQIARTIHEKMRSIDEVGWLDRQSIGVLLPVTSAEGGQGFAHRLSESIPVPPPPVLWTVYTYPEHWLPGEGSRKTQASLGLAECELPRGNDSRVEKMVGNVFSKRIPLWKRCTDLIGAVIFIGMLSPFFFFLFVYVKIVSPGKALYKQQRVGYRGKLFTFLKFRTMRENNDCQVHRQHLRELINSTKPMEKLDQARDPRIIPGGKFIRKACLDELPQLFNVIRGEMSLVGPRPCIPYEAEEYLRWHRYRFDILPGMTGLWQVSGKNKLSFEQMVRLDISYASRMSPVFDLGILLLTPLVIIGMIVEAAMNRVGGQMVKPAVVTMVKGDDKGFLRDA
jgi:lipopolysaccharide/colanic/teichoic acid biosynthesis glycosyltransferase